MKKAVILAAASAALLSGCATVDLQDMASAPVAETKVADVNVVQRAVEKLKVAFTDRGFGPRASRKKMHAAADVLLNGLNARSLQDDSVQYADTPRTTDEVTRDILLAQGHVEQTMRAAEIYIAMAPASRKMDKELESLEAALLASEKASLSFKAALDGAETAELVSYLSSVDGLRRVTDEFGARVRIQRSGKLALAAAARTTS